FATPAATGGPAPQGDAGAPPALVPTAGKRGRILVVDDDPSVRRFLVEALTEAGHSVAAAEDGERAIEIFRAHPCDVVVSDVRMGRVSGLDVLRAVKDHAPTTEVIILTAHATLDTAVTALRHGAYDLITKPLTDLETLDRLVRRALEKQRLSSENRLLVDNLQSRNLELKETVARLAAVNEIGKATTGLLDMHELYDSLVRLVAQHLKARRVSVLIADPDSDTMTLAASVGIPEHEAQNARVRVGEGIAGRVAASQSPLLVRDIEQWSLRDLRTGGKYATASFMITPLNVSYPIRYQRRRVGVINVSDKHSGDPFTEQDLEFLSTLSSQVAVAIENARLYQRSRELAVTEERNRLAREIHDTLAQGLTAISLQLESADALIDDSPARAKESLRKALDLTRVNLEEARRSVLDLRAAPLLDRSLPEAIRVLAERVERDHGLSIEVRAQGDVDRLPARLEAGAYRIVQEALHNVVRHAAARQVLVDVSRAEGRVRVLIQDDGRGFDPPAASQGFGLIGMRERARLLGGVLEVDSAPGRGTRIALEVPV
ncbi:MAG: response regulator, partial [bacterium]